MISTSADQTLAVRELLAIGIAVIAPTIVVLIGILWGFRGLDKLAARMDARFDRVDVHVDMIATELRRIYHELGRHEADIETLKRQ